MSAVAARHAHSRPEQDVKRLQLSVLSEQEGHDVGRVIDAWTMSSYGEAYAETISTLRSQRTTECQFTVSSRERWLQVVGVLSVLATDTRSALLNVVATDTVQPW